VKRRKKNEFVVDSYALLAYLHQDPGWREVGRLLRLWRRKRIRARLSWINWGEIYYITARNFGHEKAMEVLDFIAAYPVQLEPVDQALVQTAAELKSAYSFSYADAFCAATAMRHDAIILTGDPEFEAIQDKLRIHWLR
jgi:uncharacterized protein